MPSLRALSLVALAGSALVAPSIAHADPPAPVVVPDVPITVTEGEAGASVPITVTEGQIGDADEPLVATPTPGRVPVELESTGVSLDVGIHAATTTAFLGPRTLHFVRVCSTPCRLYARPGSDLHVMVEGDEHRGRWVGWVDVSLHGDRYRFHDHDAWALAGGFGLLLPGLLLTVGGGVGTVVLAVGSPAETGFRVLAGAGLGIGLALLVPGIVIVVRNTNGIASHDRLPARLSFTPTVTSQGGAVWATLAF